VIARYQTSPELFFREVLGCEPWETPRRIMDAIAVPRARVAAKACHASSKTHTAARLVLWWVYTGGIALTSAPSGTQVKAGIWAEIHTAYNAARVPLGGQLMQKELRLGPDCYALGVSTNMGVRFQGFHGRILIILDEAPGVLADIWPAIKGIRAGGDVRLLVLGNPVIASGPFYDAFTTERASWQTFTIDAFDTPNFAGVQDEAHLLSLSEEELDWAPRPYLATRRWAREMLEEGGADNADYQSRVRGRFPEQSEDSLISLAWLEAARQSAPTGASGDYWAGLDVAGPGEDSSVLYIRRGDDILSVQAWKDADPRGAVLAALAPYRERGIQVNVDAIGIGYNFARHIEDAGYIVHDINVGEAPRDKEKFANAKAEYYWGLRQRFQQGAIAGLRDEKTIGQLTGIRYQHTPRGQVQIESKDQARKRGVKSPDRAEALMLCFVETAWEGAGVWLL
jgi:phage terminase large subunit